MPATPRIPSTSLGGDLPSHGGRTAGSNLPPPSSTPHWPHWDRQPERRTRTTRGPPATRSGFRGIAPPRKSAGDRGGRTSRATDRSVNRAKPATAEGGCDGFDGRASSATASAGAGHPAGRILRECQRCPRAEAREHHRGENHERQAKDRRVPWSRVAHGPECAAKGVCMR